MKYNSASVSMVIRDPKGRILIQNHVKLGRLTIPSGKIELGEIPIDALKREMKEELGITISTHNLPLPRILHHSELISDTKAMGPIEVRYEVEVDDSFTFTNEEPDKHTWIKFMELDEIKESYIKPSILLAHVLKHGFSQLEVPESKEIV